MLNKKRSIKKRALLMSFLISIIVFILMFIAAYKIAYHETEEILDQQLKSTAQWLAEQNPILVSSHFKKDKNYHEEDIFVDIYLYSTLQAVSNLPAIIYNQPSSSGYHHYNNQGINFIAYIVPLSDRQIQVAQPLHVRKVLAFELAGTMLIPYIILLPLVLLLFYFGIQRALKPLQYLQQEFSQRQYHDLTHLNPKSFPIELDAIVREVNALFSRIELAQQEQNDFVSHAAHELRSPLTALNLQIKVLQKEDPESKNIAQLMRAIKRLQHMVQQMLALARQGETQWGNAETFVLQQLLTEVVQELYPLAHEKNIDLALVAPASTITICVDRHALYLVCRNLIDNAIKYSPEHGIVEINILHIENKLEIRFEDSGNGIDESEYTQVMRKFYRVKNVDIGSGLGLAIVQKSLLRLDAQIEFKRSDRLKGLLVIVRLPNQQLLFHDGYKK